MKKKYYDIIIIGGGASGLFCSIFLPPKKQKLIIEKNQMCGEKLLLSGGGRCNFTNMNFSPLEDYFGQNIKSLPSIFHFFGNQDMIDFLHQHDIETLVENNGKLFLKSGKAKDLLDLLIKLSQQNNVDIVNGVSVNSVQFLDGKYFEVETDVGIYNCKKLIVATGGKTYPQIGATSFACDLAHQLGIKYIPFYPCLCGIETVQDMSGITGNSVFVEMQICNHNKCIFHQKGDLLFTHWGISGPLVFNATLTFSFFVFNNADYLSKIKIKIVFDIKNLPRKLIKYLDLHENKNYLFVDIKGLRPWEEAKVSGGGILLSELKPNFESKKIPGLYFIGEACDVVGKTGGYNLQWAWSSAYVCAHCGTWED